MVKMSMWLNLILKLYNDNKHSVETKCVMCVSKIFSFPLLCDCCQLYQWLRIFKTELLDMMFDYNWYTDTVTRECWLEREILSTEPLRTGDCGGEGRRGSPAPPTTTSPTISTSELSPPSSAIPASTSAWTTGCCTGGAGPGMSPPV